MKSLSSKHTTNLPPFHAAPPLLPTPAAAKVAAPEGGRRFRLRFDIEVTAGVKARLLRAADAAQLPFHEWIVKSLEQAANDGPRCRRDGMPLVTTYPVDGPPFEECLVCRLRQELSDERARVARILSGDEIDSVGAI
jgi:hypothetical protein